MKLNIIERLKRDWFIIFLLVMIGICLMLIAGERATQFVSDWRLQANMRSNLDPNARFRSGPRAGHVEPVNSGILTPPIWNDTYLTPMGDGDDNQPKADATLVVFDPSTTPSTTPSPTTTPTVSQTPDPSPTVSATPSPSPTPVVTATKQEKDDDDPPPPPSPSPPPVASTVDPTLNQVAQPADLDVGAPDDNEANIAPGDYVVIDITNSGVDPSLTVEGPAETNYDLVYYEWDNAGNVHLDEVIIGISTEPDGDPYYEVFNWGDGTPDTNTNVDTSDPPPVLDPTEPDNQIISTSDLYDPASPPAEPQTGILIDVDNAPSNPPPGDYDYVVIISPPSGGPDSAQVDAVELVEEPPPP